MTLRNVLVILVSAGSSPPTAYNEVIVLVVNRSIPANAGRRCGRRWREELLAIPTVILQLLLRRFQSPEIALVDRPALFPNPQANTERARMVWAGTVHNPKRSEMVSFQHRQYESHARASICNVILIC